MWEAPLSVSVVITTGQTGLVKADFGFRFYLDGVATPAVLTDVTVAELGSGEYRIDGLPDGTLGQWRTLTWETPLGVGGFYVYPQPQSLSPPNLVVPVREGGLAAGDLELALYRNGTLRGDVLTATEVGSPGDYRLAGWPTGLGGDWALFWRRAGLSFPFYWTSAAGSATPTRYLEILANQRPFPFNVDESLRTMFSCNFSALAAAPTADWEGEILKVIVDAGLAVKPNPPTVTGDIWIGPAATIPAGDGPFTQIIDTGGRAPDYTHDGAKYERLSCQVVVRAKSFAAGRTRALAIWRVLDSKRNVTLAA